MLVAGDAAVVRPAKLKLRKIPMQLPRDDDLVLRLRESQRTQGLIASSGTSGIKMG
jgi:hypothetical protein